jgi:hypothetical protein
VGGDQQPRGYNQANLRETFATKICYGRGPRFDPILEDKSGWVDGDVAKQSIVLYILYYIVINLDYHLALAISMD